MPVSRQSRLASLVLILLGLSSGAPAAEPFTLIVVPDTQNYTDGDDDTTNNRYNLGQTRWIRDNMTNLNIKFVMHLGDHQNPGNPYRASTTDIYSPDMSRPVGDVAYKQTVWNRADAAIDVLDNNNIPYALVPGNHDYHDHDTQIEPWKYLQVFGPQRYINEQATWAESKRTYGGASPAHPVNQYAGMNTYHRFDAGGYKFLNLAMQAYPDEHDLRWAQQIINENPGLPTIVSTHVFVAPNGSYQHPELFNTLVKNNPQVVMAFNGHRTGSRRTEDTNVAGLPVQNMLVDYQAVQLDAQLGGNYYRGGGVLHIVQVNPDTNRVTVKGYSPVADRYLPNSFDAPDNDGVDFPFRASNFGFDLDLEAQFGLANKAGIVRSVSFQQGVNGYSGTGDTYIDANSGAANYGNEDTVWVDGDRNGATSGNPDSHAMIRFNTIFGNGPNQIPAGAQIESAELVLHTSDRTDAESPNTIALHRLLQNWTELGAVWDTFNGFETNGLEAILAANDTSVPNEQNAFASFDVTESLYALSMGATDMGWVLLPGGGNGWQFDSSEHANALYRPQLNVTYRVVPEPASIGMLACAAMLMLARRR
jgi:hypothetical protein